MIQKPSAKQIPSSKTQIKLEPQLLSLTYHLLIIALVMSFELWLCTMRFEL